MVKKRVRAARVMLMRVVGDEEGGGDGGNMSRNNDYGLIPVVVQQAVLHSASARHRQVDRTTTGMPACMLRTDDVGGDPTTTTMTATSSCRPLV